MLETVVSPFYSVVQYAAHQRAVLGKNNEQTSPGLQQEGLTSQFLPPTCETGEQLKKLENVQILDVSRSIDINCI